MIIVSNTQCKVDFTYVFLAILYVVVFIKFHFLLFYGVVVSALWPY